MPALQRDLLEKGAVVTNDRYPILIERWDEKYPSDAVVCARCEATFKWDPSEGDPYDLCATHGNATLGECGGHLIYKFEEGERCKACGKLDFSMPLPGVCSRKCQLQAEYAETLKGSAA